MNLLIITADDLSYCATGIGGCEIKNITPNIDELAQNGFYFDNAHATVGLCQPSRSVLMTGLYPWNNGALGFEPIKAGTETLVTILKRYGYFCGIMGKNNHLAPPELFQWDYNKNYLSLGDNGKSPIHYYQRTEEFFKQSDKPFFLLANINDPHRNFPENYIYDLNSILIPKFLSDNEATRKELSQYYTAVNRCDKTVGLILQALKDSGKLKDTLIVFTSDHGMAFPFVKANCYHHSSRVPLIYNHVNIKPNKDISHLVSGIDFLPSILEFMGLKYNFNFDGRSYYEILNGEYQNNRTLVYTCLCKNYPGNKFETRAIHSLDYCYICNFWSDGVNVFVEDGCLDNQPSYYTLHENKKHYVRFRVPEEFYDLKQDPYAQKNLINNLKNLPYIRDLMRKIAVKYNDKLVLTILK